jgi:hypothetical protein
LIEAYAAERKVVHVIRGEAKEVARLGNMMNMESPEYEGRIKHPNNPTRRVKQQICSFQKNTDIPLIFKLISTIHFLSFSNKTVSFTTLLNADTAYFSSSNVLYEKVLLFKN